MQNARPSFSTQGIPGNFRISRENPESLKNSRENQ